MDVNRHRLVALCLLLVIAGACLACSPPGTEPPAANNDGPAVSPTSASPVEVVLETERGDIVLALYPAQAPRTVENFLTYVDRGLFEGATFYRTVTSETDRGDPAIEVIQGGLYLDDPPIPPVEHESTAHTGLLHVDGAISMARAEVGTAGSEFFICIGDQPGLDHGALRNPDGEGFAVFGKVIEGMEVVREIHTSPADGPSESEYMRGQMLGPPVAILSFYRRER